MRKINKTLLPPGKMVPISFDKAFKKMWGDENGKSRVALLLSKIFKIEYYYLRDNIEFLNVEYTADNKDDKSIRSDVVIRLKLKDPDNKNINLEMNMDNHNPNIERNLSYLCKIYYDSTKNLKTYNNVDQSVQINFNTTFINKNNKEVIEEYYLNNKENTLTNKFKIIEINIAECYNIWYSKDIKMYPNSLQDLIKLGALMTIKDRDIFNKCLEDINMEKDVKNDIKNTVDNFNSDNTIVLPWTEAEQNERDYNTTIELITKEATENGLEKGMKQGLEQGMKKGIEQGIELGTKQIAEAMLKENIDINIIEKCTGLTKAQIESLK